MTASDQLVLISRTQHTNRRHHTDPDCPNLPADDERIREVEYRKLNSSYALCEICEHGVKAPDEMGTVACPECGEAVKTGGLRAHLPCDGAEVVADD